MVTRNSGQPGSDNVTIQIRGMNSISASNEPLIIVDGIPYSGFYSQEDIQEIIDYANDRFITIIPEIDMPGHTRAALASYPKLSCKGYPFKVSTHWGIHKDILCVGKEEVFEFAQGILIEIVNLFPSKSYFLP